MQARSLLLLALAALALVAAPAVAGHHDDGAVPRHHLHRHSRDHGMTGDWQGDTLVLEDGAGSGGRVAITPEGGLTVGDAAVPVDRDGRQLLQDFYGRYVGIEEEAALIGQEGARLGVAGAALAARALARVVRLDRDDYDQQDLEREMETEVARMEAKGTALERRGAAIEALADDLRDAAAELRAKIPALGALDWFRLEDDGESAAAE